MALAGYDPVEAPDLWRRMSEASGGGGQPEFLSTHPDPGNRIEHFHNSKTTMGCTGDGAFESEYKAMVSKLP